MDVPVLSAVGSQEVSILRVSRPFAGTPGAVCRALTELGWLGREVERPADALGTRRFEVDLGFELPGDRNLTLRKAALVDVSTQALGARGCVAEIAWRASGLAPLFPVFAGRLVVRGGSIELDGVYVPPGGGVGLLVDRAVLHRFARRTGDWFIDRLVEATERSPAD